MRILATLVLYVVLGPQLPVLVLGVPLLAEAEGLWEKLGFVAVASLMMGGVAAFGAGCAHLLCLRYIWSSGNRVMAVTLSAGLIQWVVAIGALVVSWACEKVLM